MNIRFSEHHSDPNSVSYYAPQRHRSPRETDIRPVLERLSRGEPAVGPWPVSLDASAPSELPRGFNSEPMPPLSRPPLGPDLFSVIGRAVTVLACVGALAAGAAYLFAPGEKVDDSTRGLVARRGDRLDVEARTPKRETVAAAVEPAVSADPAVETVVPASAAAAGTVADEPVSNEMPAANAAARPDTSAEIALMAPLKMWAMFPTASAAPAAEDSMATPEEPAEASPPAKPRAARKHRAHRAKPNPAPAQASDGQASSQNGAQAAENNPLQAALRKLFTPKQ